MPRRGSPHRCRQPQETEPLDRSTMAKIASPAPAAVVARNQRRPSVECGDVAATDAIAARVAAIVIAARVAPTSTCVRVTIAIVVIVVPRRGGGGDCGREQFVPVPVLSTRNPSGRPIRAL